MRSCLDAGLPVLVVDDGSSDRTSDIARDSGATVLTLLRSRGVGRATAEGLRWAAQYGMSAAVTLDGDGQHLPSDGVRVLARIDAGADLAIGCRFSESRAAIPVTKQISNALAATLVNGLTRGCFTDVSCGLRAYRLACRVDGQHGGFGWLYESLVIAIRSGLCVVSEPVTALYGEDALLGTPVREMAQFLDTVTPMYPAESAVRSELLQLRRAVEMHRALSIQWRTSRCEPAVQVRGRFANGAYSFEYGADDDGELIRLDLVSVEP